MSGATSAVQQGSLGKMLGLEVVRFACAFGVLVWHYQHFYEMAGAPAYDRAAQPLYPLLALFYEYGQFGVQIFWAISGFIFFWKYGELVGAGGVDGRRFFWLRFSRLYPLHFVTLLLVAALQPVHAALTGESFIYGGNDLPNFALQLGMATQWIAPDAYSFNGPIWSVSAEVLVYAFFFLFVRRFGPSPWLIAAVIGACIAAMVAGIGSPAILCAGFFFAGGASARAMLHGLGRGEVVGPRCVAAAMLAVVLGGAWWTGLLGAVAALPLVLLLAAPPLLVLAAQDWRLLHRWEAPIQAAGNLTYSSYLCHFPLQLGVAIAAAASGWAAPVASPLFLATYLGVTLVVARWTFERFERPAQDLIRALALRRTPALAS